MKYILQMMILGMLIACARTQTNYIPIFTAPTQVKQFNEIEYFPEGTQRSGFCIAKLVIKGNRYATFEDLIDAAKTKAAYLGGDFVLPYLMTKEIDGIPETYDVQVKELKPISPNTVIVVLDDVKFVYEWEVPLGIFFVYLYAPTKSGLIVGADGVVTGFTSSETEAAGIKVGDQLLCVDGIQAFSDQAMYHLYKAKPGDQMLYRVRRGEEELDIAIKALTNS